MLATILPSHSQGLSSASRVVKHIAPEWLVKRMVQLETCYSVLRHVTVHTCLDMEVGVARVVESGLERAMDAEFEVGDKADSDVGYPGDV